MPTAPSRSNASKVWLDPSVANGMERLRAALLAMGLIPEPLPLDAKQRTNILASLGDSQSVAFVDISAAPGRSTAPLADLCAKVPSGTSRDRIYLSRMLGGHVSPQDQRWAQALGFADLVPTWEGRDHAREFRDTLLRLAAQTGVRLPATKDLTQYLRVLAQASDAVPARSLVHRMAGRSPEDLAEQLSTTLDIRERSWSLSHFPHCFVGNEAVDVMAKRLDAPRDTVVAVGAALGTLGLLVHVAHEHSFADQSLFFRLAWSRTLDAVSLGQLWQGLVSSLPTITQTRLHHGTSYADCFVGAEAVAQLATSHKLSRFDAWLALHRLAQWGFIEHVLHEKPFIDGTFFYRWVAAPAGVDLLGAEAAS